MRKIFMVLLGFLILNSNFVFADSYSVKSKDGEVKERKDVVVSVTKSIVIEKTITQIDKERAHIAEAIANYNAKTTALEARDAYLATQRSEVVAESNKVTLGVE